MGGRTSKGGLLAEESSAAALTLVRSIPIARMPLRGAAKRNEEGFTPLAGKAHFRKEVGSSVIPSPLIAPRAPPSFFFVVTLVKCANIRTSQQAFMKLQSI